VSKSTDIFSKIPKLDYEEEAINCNFKEFKKVVESRRSVRVYDDTEISEEIMQRCFDMALLAPNSSNLQPWEFYWVKSPDKKKKLVQYCLEQPAARTAKELVVCVGRTGNWKEHSEQMLQVFSKNENVPKSAILYYKKLVPLSYTIGPLGILGLIKKIITYFLAFKRPIPRGPYNIGDIKTIVAKTCALAAENFMLAMRAFGFDTCPMEGMDGEKIKKLLNLPKDGFIVMVISCGKRAKGGVYGPRIRFDREKFIFKV
jgi:nitroreductase